MEFRGIEMGHILSPLAPPPKKKRKKRAIRAGSIKCTMPEQGTRHASFPILFMVPLKFSSVITNR
jgi:hypothetical protein